MNFELSSKDVLITSRHYDNCLTIPNLNAEDITYSDFFENFMSKNLPCLIKNVSKNWDANQNWVKNGKINFDFMQENYGHTDIMLYNCSKKYFNSQECTKSVFSDYVNYWEKRMTGDPIYYLKDWHLKLQCRNNEFYKVPIFYASDWLNEYFLQCLSDDYRFVYMGPKGSWTPLHTDVFSSYSWSVNVFGKKRWIFIPPGTENNLKDHLNNLVYDINEIPLFKNYIEVFQDTGDAIFVPSGWYHQVWNLEDTISINHNWINGCNIDCVWDSLRQNLENVEKEIEDCKNMDHFENHCQVMLNSLFGMDYKTFYDMLKCVACNRIIALCDPSKRTLYHGHNIGINHILFDLEKCNNILKEFVNSDYVKNHDFNDVKNLISEIEETLLNKHIP